MADDKFQVARDVKKFIEHHSDYALHARFIDYLNHLSDVEDELNYHKAIMNGSWPSAVEKLQSALDNAKKLRTKKIPDSLAMQVFLKDE